jgi:hypothetical protein
MSTLAGRRGWGTKLVIAGLVTSVIAALSCAQMARLMVL